MVSLLGLLVEPVPKKLDPYINHMSHWKKKPLHFVDAPAGAGSSSRVLHPFWINFQFPAPQNVRRLGGIPWTSKGLKG